MDTDDENDVKKWERRVYSEIFKKVGEANKFVHESEKTWGFRKRFYCEATRTYQCGKLSKTGFVVDLSWNFNGI